MMRAALAALHQAFDGIIIDPLDSARYEQIDNSCYVIWEWCLMTGETPWRWCPDVYCSCKVALSEHEPDALPGF